MSETGSTEVLCEQRPGCAQRLSTEPGGREEDGRLISNMGPRNSEVGQMTAGLESTLRMFFLQPGW